MIVTVTKQQKTKKNSDAHVITELLVKVWSLLVHTYLTMLCKPNGLGQGKMLVLKCLNLVPYMSIGAEKLSLEADWCVSLGEVLYLDPGLPLSGFLLMSTTIVPRGPLHHLVF